MPRPNNYFREIGGKGGKAGQGSAAKQLSAKAAADARWENNERRPVTLTVRGSNVWLSRKVKGLPRALAAEEGHREGKVIVWKRVSLLQWDGPVSFAPLTVLHRIREFLREESITYHVNSDTKPFYRQMKLDLRGALEGFTRRKRRVLKWVLQQPAAALCRATEEEWQWLLLEVLRIFRPARAIIVVEESKRVDELYEYLGHHLMETIGLLAGHVDESKLDGRRITIMLSDYLTKGIVLPDQCDIIVFDRCPREGFTEVAFAQGQFPQAWRMARLGEEKRGYARLLGAESFFGAIHDVSKTLSGEKP